MSEGAKKASPLQAVRIVLSAFLGIRKRAEHEKVEITPVQIIVTGVIAGAVFVVTIVSVVRWVTS